VHINCRPLLGCKKKIEILFGLTRICIIIITIIKFPKLKMSTQVFEASVFVSDQLTRLMVNASQDLAQRCVTECAQRYGFDAEEAIRHLGIHMIKLERKASGTKTMKKVKAPKEKVVKPAFPLPYNGEFNDACCYALRQNNGLYTQCTGSRKADAQFCKACVKNMEKNLSDVPEYGTIQQRQAVGIFEYADPKGRKPTAFAKVMKKYKLTEEQVLEEAAKFNITIAPEHFVVEESKRGRPKTEKQPKEKGQKGRPKKSKKVLEIEGDDEDLFASLVAQANSDDSEPEEEDIVIPKKAKKEPADKAEKEAAKAAEKAKKEAAKAAEKAEKEAAKAAEKKKKEDEKAAEKAKKEADKAEKEAAKAAEKAEKEAKLAAEKAAKIAEKEAKSKKPEKSEPKKTAKKESNEGEVVQKITFEGKKYLRSKSSGIIYDLAEYVNNGEQVIVGKWNESKNKIDFKSDGDVSEEEEEEEYDD
jgi:hypothetical protein